MLARLPCRRRRRRGWLDVCHMVPIVAVISHVYLFATSGSVSVLTVT